MLLQLCICTCGDKSQRDNELTDFIFGSADDKGVCVASTRRGLTFNSMTCSYAQCASCSLPWSGDMVGRSSSDQRGPLAG